MTTTIQKPTLAETMREAFNRSGKGKRYAARIAKVEAAEKDTEIADIDADIERVKKSRAETPVDTIAYAALGREYDGLVWRREPAAAILEGRARIALNSFPAAKDLLSDLEELRDHFKARREQVVSDLEAVYEANQIVPPANLADSLHELDGFLQKHLAPAIGQLEGDIERAGGFLGIGANWECAVEIRNYTWQLYGCGWRQVTETLANLKN